MAAAAAVYRSSRLSSINPTAAINEDTSYLYTLVRLWCAGAAQRFESLALLVASSNPFLFFFFRRTRGARPRPRLPPTPTPPPTSTFATRAPAPAAASSTPSSR